MLNADEVPRVRVSVRGSENRLQPLLRAPFRIDVSINPVPADGPAEVTKPISPEHVQLPAGVALVEGDPKAVSVSVDAKVRVPVQPRFVGKLPPGDGVDSWRVQPRKVDVSGPKKHVQRISRVYIEEVDRSGISTYDRDDVLEKPKLPLQPQPRVRYDPDWVLLKMELYAKADTTYYDELPIRVLRPVNWPHRVRFLEPHSQRVKGVTLAGPKDDIDRQTTDRWQILPSEADLDGGEGPCRPGRGGRYFDRSGFMWP